MAQRKPVVGLSLKTYINSIEKTRQLATNLDNIAGREFDIEQFFLPSLGTIYSLKDILQYSSISYGAQNISPYANGAFTGEFSIESLIELGGKYVEIGHNERITLFNETHELINRKIILTLSNNLIPVICIGEGNNKVHFSTFEHILTTQLQNYFSGIITQKLKQVIVAYEPGWAIGKEQAASPNHIHQAHQIIRKCLKNNWGEDVSEAIRIIYGGSVSKENTPEIIKNRDVDGVFLGRFGHSPENYKKILSIVKPIKNE